MGAMAPMFFGDDMRVKIGRYLNFWGPWQIIGLLKFIGVPERTRDVIFDYMKGGRIDKFLNWVHGRRKRTIKIRIDPWDTWGMDHTLALIVLPLLRQLKEEKHGSPYVDDEDVPENIRKTAAPPVENEYDTDEFFHVRWDYVIDEIIWTFEQLATDDCGEDQFHIECGEIDFDSGQTDEGWELKWKREPVVDRDGVKRHDDRIQNGLRLFGKYYRSLWS